MRASELIKIFEENPDFEVAVVTTSVVNDRPCYQTYNIIGLADVAYSDKVIVLDSEKQ